MNKIRTVTEMIVFMAGVCLIFSIPFFIAIIKNDYATLAFGMGIAEGLLLSSFTRNLGNFSDMFSGWKMELTDK